MQVLIVVQVKENRPADADALALASTWLESVVCHRHVS